jgi:hypothetical protein
MPYIIPHLHVAVELSILMQIKLIFERVWEERLDHQLINKSCRTFVFDYFKNVMKVSKEFEGLLW